MQNNTSRIIEERYETQAKVVDKRIIGWNDGGRIESTIEKRGGKIIKEELLNLAAIGGGEAWSSSRHIVYEINGEKKHAYIFDMTIEDDDHRQQSIIANAPIDTDTVFKYRNDFSGMD
jgi:hypothetical protein